MNIATLQTTPSPTIHIIHELGFSLSEMQLHQSEKSQQSTTMVIVMVQVSTITEKYCQGLSAS